MKTNIDYSFVANKQDCFFVAKKIIKWLINFFDKNNYQAQESYKEKSKQAIRAINMR
jgi:hypothetical protein